jgi:hypothetical protein
MNKKKLLAYLILIIVLGGCVGGIVTGIVLGGWKAFFMFLTALGIIVIGVGTIFAVVWASRHITDD